MTINSRQAAFIRIESGSRPKVVSASVLARVISQKVHEAAGSVEVYKIEIVGQFAKIGKSIRSAANRIKTAEECMAMDTDVFVSIAEVDVQLQYAGTSHATMRELYRTMRVIEVLDRIFVRVNQNHIFVNDVPYGGLTKAYREPDEISSNFMHDLDRAINGEREYEEFADEFKDYEYGTYGLHHITRGVLKALNYDYRHHHIHITEDYKDAHVVLTIPEGKTASDKEVTTLWKIFRNYVYHPDNGRTPKFDLYVKGTLTHTVEQPWENDPNFTLHEN
jgi:hypothetical protein